MNPEALLAHDDFLRGLAKSLVYGSEEADDVVQEAFVAALRRPPREGPTVRGYLATILRNVLRQKRRGEARRAAREARAARPDEVPSELEIRAREEERRRVVDAVFDLDTPMRETVLLRYFENLPPREIASRLDVPVNTVKSRLRRAHEKLRTRLDDGHRGDRAAWAGLLLPLADAKVGAGAATATVVGKAALVGGLAAAVGLAVFLSAPGTPDTPPPAPFAPTPVAVSAVEPEDGPPVGTGVLTGKILRDGEPADARVEAVRLAAIAEPEDGPLDGYTHLFSDPGGDAAIVYAGNVTDGTYRVSDLPTGYYEIRALAPDGATGSAGAVIIDPGGTVTVDVDLTAPRHRLRGRAVHADGRPFRGRVGVISRGFAPGGQARATDDEGRFVLEDLPPGEVRLTALVTPDLRVWGPPFTLPSNEEQELVVDGTWTRLPGRTESAATEEEISGALVVMFAGRFVARAVSGRDGSFRIPVSSEKCTLMAAARGFANVREEVAPEADRIVLRLSPRAGISGRVTAELDDRPVPGAVVRWRRGFMAPDEKGRTTTDAQGRYELTGIPPGKVRVYVHGGGWTSPSAAGRFEMDRLQQFEVNVPAGAALRRDLVAVKTGSVEGRVLDAAGRPAAGVTVVVDHGMFARMQLEVEGPGRKPGTTTDEEGRFRFENLLPGVEVTIHARPGDGRPSRSAKVSPVQGEIHRLELRLVPARTVTVEVVCAVTGAPVRGARVLVREWNRGGGGGEYTADLRTDPSGRAIVKAAPPERLQVNAEHERFVKESRHYPAEPGQETVRIEMQPGHSLSGRVTWPDGSPAAKVPVGAFAFYPGEKYQVSANAWTDENGGFELERLPAGELTIQANAEREGKPHGLKAKVEAGTTGLDLQLVQTGSASRWLRVRVLDSEGRPVHRAWSLFYNRRDDGSGGGSGLEDADRGDLKIDVPADPFTGWLEIFRAEDEKRRPLPVGAVFLGPIRPGQEPIEVRLPPEKVIEGVIVDEAGNGVPEAKVSARPAAGDGPKRPVNEVYEHAIAVTGPDGRYRLGRLADRAYRLTVRPPLAYARPAPREVPAGASSVTIHLQPSTNPVLTVVDPEGRPVPGASVRVTLPHRTDEMLPLFDQHVLAAGKADASGRVRLRGLDPRTRYRLEVGRPSGRKDLAGRVVRDWAPQEETITLPAK